VGALESPADDDRLHHRVFFDHAVPDRALSRFPNQHSAPMDIFLPISIVRGGICGGKWSITEKGLRPQVCISDRGSALECH
jgi:hypothetical protein